MGQEAQAIFRSKSDTTFPALSCAQLRSLHQALLEFGMQPEQIIEAASYSLAMVVRYALGLSAQGGQVGAVISSSLSGSVALGTVRHLVNSGAVAQIILLEHENSLCSHTQKQLALLRKMHVAVCSWPGEASGGARMNSLLESCHNIICGFSDPLSTSPAAVDGYLIDMLNEASTPLHAIEAPYGIDPDSGEPQQHPLFCSSTLSLGAPLCGLFYGSEYTGRHYLCDISLTPEMYRGCGANLAGLFAEQPVLQIFPLKPEE